MADSKVARKPSHVSENTLYYERHLIALLTVKCRHRVNDL